jgi:hypothetical protein
MMVSLRSLVLALVLGMHNAWEQEEQALIAPGVRYKVAQRVPMGDAWSRPERNFLWGESSLMN